MKIKEEQLVKIQGEPASLLRRLGAMLYDAMLLVALWMLCGAIFLIFSQGEVIDHSQPLLMRLQQVAFIFVWLVFFTFFWWRDRQTLGMRAWRIYLLTKDQHSLSIQQILLRLLVSLLSFFCLGLGYLWMLFHPQRAAWHDSVSRTKIIYMPKKKS